MAVREPEFDGRSDAFIADSISAAYENSVATVLHEPWAQALLELVELEPSTHVLDLASGTGVVAREAARRVGEAGSVTAIDISSAMLSRSAANPPAMHAAPIRHFEASAESLPFADGAFDVIICQQGLQFFPDPQDAVHEMRRVLRPGGKVVIAVWARGYPAVPFNVYCEELERVGAQPPYPRAFDMDTYTMSVLSVTGLLEEARFSEVAGHRADLDVTWATAEMAAGGVLGTPFAPSVQALSERQRAEYDAAVLAQFAPEVPGGPVRRRTSAVIATATA